MKAAIMLEELLEAGCVEAEYDAWPIRIADGEQFGTGFTSLNPNSKIPALLDKSGAVPIRIFESGAILLHLAQKFSKLIPERAEDRAECLSWLFWQIGAAPYIGGGLGHFYAYAPMKIEYAIDRFAMETQRLFDVLDRRLAAEEYVAGSDYGIADIACWPWFNGLLSNEVYGAAAFLSLADFVHVGRWASAVADRPAVRRGRLVNKAWGDPATQMPERHSASDFDKESPI